MNCPPTSLALGLAETLFMQRRRRRNALVVEDDPCDAELAMVELGKSFDVKHAATGREAIELSAAEIFDLAVVDLNLAGESGLIVADRLRAEHPEMKIVICSGHVDGNAIMDALRFKFTILPKPLCWEDLPAFVNRNKTATTATT